MILLILQRREAFEEVDLPLGDVPHLHKLTELEPFLSKYKIIVFRKLPVPYSLLPLIVRNLTNLSARSDHLPHLLPPPNHLPPPLPSRSQRHLLPPVRICA